MCTYDSDENVYDMTTLGTYTNITVISVGMTDSNENFQLGCSNKLPATLIVISYFLELLYILLWHLLFTSSISYMVQAEDGYMHLVRSSG